MYEGDLEVLNKILSVGDNLAENALKEKEDFYCVVTSWTACIYSTLVLYISKFVLFHLSEDKEE